VFDLSFLESDLLRHADMTEALHYGATPVAALPDGVLIRDGEDNSAETGGASYLLSAATPETLNTLLDALPTRPAEVVTHQIFARAIIAERLRFVTRYPCFQSVYLADTLPTKPREDLNYEWLSGDYVQLVHQTYSLGLQLDYVRERVNSSNVLGAFLPNSALPTTLRDPDPLPLDASLERTLVGFVGIHGGGSMGMLEVLPRFRRQGIGESLVIELMGRRIASGHLAFDQIIETNQASYSLQRKLGFTISAESFLAWMRPMHQ
jgi:tRNA (guanine37-N1)-methyltransferase